jgi:tetratricopeptide (TPR) repeat protein
MWSIATLARYSVVRRLQDALAVPRHALLVAIIVVATMGTATGILARWYHEERAKQARHQMSLGDRLAAEGAIDAALDHYRAALALDRDNPVHRRAVALLLLQVQRFAEAERHLDELLERNPVDAEANLLRARLAARRGVVENAEAYYQRAIYGRWPSGAEQAQRLAARFELLAWLEQIGAMDRARAELMRLQAEVPGTTTSMQLQLARHFVILGESRRAVDILRKQLTQDPDDRSLAREMMNVALSARQLEDARVAARRMVTLDPKDAPARRVLQQLTDALNLDPTRRRLSTAERLRRSGALLTRLVALTEQCSAAPDVAVPADAIIRARELLDTKATLATRNTLIEERLAAAEALWVVYGPRCRTFDEPLGWVFDRLQQS